MYSSCQALGRQRAAGRRGAARRQQRRTWVRRASASPASDFILDQDPGPTVLQRSMKKSSSEGSHRATRRRFLGPLARGGCATLERGVMAGRGMRRGGDSGAPGTMGEGRVIWGPCRVRREGGAQWRCEPAGRPAAQQPHSSSRAGVRHGARGGCFPSPWPWTPAHLLVRVLLLLHPVDGHPRLAGAAVAGLRRGAAGGRHRGGEGVAPARSAKPGRGAAQLLQRLPGLHLAPGQR